MMETEELYTKFRRTVNSRPEEFVRDYQKVEKAVRESSARYLGDPIDFLYQPVFFSPADVEWIKGLLRTLNRILDKTVEKYLRDESFREVFPFSAEAEELILADPGYDQPYPIARFDVFYDFNGRLQFCEFNTDGSAGMNEARVLQNVIGQSKAMDWLGEEYEVFAYTPLEALIEEILKLYREFAGENESPERVAIVDFEGEGVKSEFREFRKRFEDRGHKAVICDPRELSYDGEKLLCGADPVDLIYRRATTRRVLDRYGEVEDFLQAYKDQKVCVVGGFRSQIVHNKSLFAILQERDWTEYLTDEEVKFIDRHFPFTRIYRERDTDLRQKLLEEKDNYLLKPFDKFAGHGVFVGEDFSREEWEEKLGEVEGEDYIAQEFCDLAEKEFLYHKGGHLKFEKFGYLIGLFLYNQELKGLYTRAGRENVIASLVECFTLPNFVVGEAGNSRITQLDSLSEQ